MAQRRTTRRRRREARDHVPPADWSVDHPAVWREVVHGQDRAIGLRHPTHPYVATSTGEADDLRTIAAAYLRRVGPALGLPSLFEGAGASFRARLSWLDVAESVPPAPRASFWIRRDATPPAAAPLDRTLVLLAVQSVRPNEPDTALGSRLGIRVVAHLSRRRGTGWEVRITGAWCSADLARAIEARARPFAVFLEGFFSLEGFGKLRTLLLGAASLPDGTVVWIDGVRARSGQGAQADAELYATLPPPEDQPQAVAHAMTFGLRLGGDVPRILPVERVPLVAHLAAPRVRLFPLEPASQAGIGHLVDARPNRAPDRLEKYRRPTALAGLAPGGGAVTSLIDDHQQVQVLRSRLVDPAADETKTHDEQLAKVPDARAHAFGAVSSYRHARELFDTMRRYGLRPAEYFKFARWPLRVRYRARIRPGPGKDGRTVNAQVTYDPPDDHLVVAAWKPGSRKPLQVRFGLADVKRSSSRREQLGLAADPRWSWHEYSHVLLAAATGALELRFVHSLGDALAAITSDPASALAVPATLATSAAPARHPRMRGLTFPWVYVNRRHDRSVFHGWSWCGRYHRQAQFPAGGRHGRRKGYQSEQILSTSLFRLYRALGGDTSRDADATPDVAARRRAADYTVYLVLRTIGLLGPAAWVPAETPDQLVSALIDADVGTLPASAGPLRHRVGGWAHKVIRWAFEAQGLYATTDPLAVVDAPGLPPPVDVFIDDRRPATEGAFPRGGYEPVSLDWGATARPPLWHAADDAIAVGRGRVLKVTVRNRGAQDAAGVTVGVWYAHWKSSDPVPPAWNTSAWKSLAQPPARTVHAWPASETFVISGLPAPRPRARLLVLAVATCPADRANVDPATHLPTATERTPIVDLVAGDNNLGLRVL